jgi:tRNA 2-selenouridine synthase
MTTILPPAEFLTQTTLLLDTRSPGEFAAGHIPGAISFPLFTDEERAAVGTCYKQVSPEAALELGLELVGPKMVEFVRQAKALIQIHQSGNRQIRVHCWRGGMRSSSMAWLLETAGLQVTLLEGGYKSFRLWVRSTLAEPRPIVALGGMTGTGKTVLLKALEKRGEPILDLEHWANHKGSSYGALGLPPQPSQEQFDNYLAIAWDQLPHDRTIWIEAESKRIGLCRIPDELLMPLFQAPVLQIERSREYRLELLEKEYGKLKIDDLITATKRITKRIGGQNANQAVEYILAGDLKPAIALVLDYYDKSYLYDLHRRNVPIYPIPADGLSDDQIVDCLLQQAAIVMTE